MVKTSQDGVVSVVIPTKDRPRLLRETIASVLAQGAYVREIIVCDDGSQPAASDSIDPGIHPQLRFVRHASSVGIGANWFSGLRAAEGPWVALLPDDDRWDPCFLSVLVPYMTEEVDVVFCGTVLIDYRGEYLDTETRLADHFRNHHDLPPGRLSQYDFIRAAVVNLDVPLNGAVVRRDVLLPLLDGETGLAMDFDITAKLALLGARAVYVPFRGVQYRWHAASLTGKNSSLAPQSFVTTADKLMAAFPTMPSWARGSLLARKRDALMSWAWLEVAAGNSSTARLLLRRAGGVSGRRPARWTGLLLTFLRPGWFAILRTMVIRARTTTSVLGTGMRRDGRL